MQEEIVAGTVQLVGAGLDRQAHDAVAGLAVFRGEVALQHPEFIHRIRRDTFIPLRVRRDQRDGHAVDEDVGSAFLPTVHLEIVARIASRIVGYAAHKSRDEFDKLHGIANGAGNL